MSPTIAAVVFFVGILALFYLDWNPKSRTSIAICIPVAWMLVAGSRMASQWMSLGAPTDNPDQYLEGSPIDRNYLTTLLVLALIVLIRRREQVVRLLQRNTPILLFFSYCALSIAWSDYPDVAFKRWIKAGGNLVMVLVVLTDPGRTSAIGRFLTSAGFVLTPLSILFIKYYPDLGRGYHPWDWTPFYTGVTTNKNELGMICLVVGLASVWSLLRAFKGGRASRKPLLAHLAVLGMLGWLFWKAQSMTSLSCFMLASGVMIAMSSPRLARMPGIIHLLVAAVLSISASALFLNIGSGLVQTLGKDPTLTGRTEIWHLVLSMVTNPMVGTGFESFWLGKRLEKIWSIYWWHPNEAHDGYIELYLNLGWIGITLLVLAIVSGYRNIVVGFRRDPDLGRLKLAYFVAAVAYNFTEAAFRMMSPVFIVFLLATIAVPEVRARTKAKARAPAARQAVHSPAIPSLEEV